MKEWVYKHVQQGDLRIRIYEPDSSGELRPAVVFYFGGGWKKGNLDQFKTHSEHLARHGMVAACAEYRVSDLHGTTPIECVEDGRSAYRWLKKHALDFGINPSRIAAGGGSAGGHVALCVSLADDVNATSDDLSVTCDPKLLVLFNPVCDVLSRGNHFGNEEIASSISPLHLVKSQIQPSTLCYGSADRMIKEGRAFVQRSRDLGVESELFVAEGEKHAFFNHSPWLESTTDVMHHFLHRHGYVSLPSDVETDEEASLHNDAIGVQEPY